MTVIDFVALFALYIGLPAMVAATCFFWLQYTARWSDDRLMIFLYHTMWILGAVGTELYGLLTFNIMHLGVVIYENRKKARQRKIEQHPSYIPPDPTATLTHHELQRLLDTVMDIPEAENRLSYLKNYVHIMNFVQNPSGR